VCFPGAVWISRGLSVKTFPLKKTKKKRKRKEREREREREREKDRERPVLETFVSTTPNFEMLCSVTRQGRGSHVCSLGLKQVQAPLRTRRRRRGRCVCGKAEGFAPGDVDDMRVSS